MKRMAVFFIAVMAAGYALHQTSRVTKTLPDGWNTLTDYAIGVMGVLPFFDITLKLLGFTDEQILKASMAYLATFVTFGVGVSWGRLNDKQSDTQEK